MKYLVIHHTAVSRFAQPVQVYPVNRFHRDERGYPLSSKGWHIGYNDFIDVTGLLYRCRAWGEETMAQVGHNCDIPSRCDAISVCLGGNFNRELLNDKQIFTLRAYIDRVRREYPDIQIVFHRDIQPNRTCAGALFTEAYLRQRILREEMEDNDEVDEMKEQGTSFVYTDRFRALVDYYKQLLAIV